MLVSNDDFKGNLLVAALLLPAILGSHLPAVRRHPFEMSGLIDPLAEILPERLAAGFPRCLADA